MSDIPTVSLPILHVRGSHYDVGYHTGATFENRIKMFYQRSILVQEQLLPFYATRRGREVSEIYLRGVRDTFPDLVQEIKGMADGVGMSFEEIFNLNIAKEIYNVHVLETDNLGCSDIMINTPSVKILGHTEDCDPQTKHFGYIVSAHVMEESVDEAFTAFSYPGSLPGNNFAFNKHGMVFACNGLYPKHATLGSTPRYFLNRAMIAATSATHAVDIGRNVGGGCAFGFNLNMGSWKHPQEMWALEIGPGETESKVNLHTLPEHSAESDKCCYVHTNTYRHLKVVEMDNLQSTNARMKRILELKAPTTLPELKEILGDTENERYPIYRTPSATDNAQTVATAIFDLLEKRMDVYMDNPKFTPTPLFSLPLV